MGHRYVAPPFTACPEWSERGGAGIDFPNRPFLKDVGKAKPTRRGYDQFPFREPHNSSENHKKKRQPVEDCLFEF